MKPFGSDFKKKNDLKKRLYESGISYFPMPSVVRPIETNSGMKSFSANMNAGKSEGMCLNSLGSASYNGFCELQFPRRARGDFSVECRASAVSDA